VYIQGIGWDSWQTSGTLRTGFETGSTSIQFKSLSCWREPSNSAVTIVGNQNVSKTFTYYSEKPDPPSASGKTICQGETASLYASGSGTIKWYRYSSGGSAINTGSTYSVSPSSSTTYYVAATNGSCESERRSVRVTVNPKPSAPNASNKTICYGETASLSASGSGTIKWYRYSSGGSPIHTGSTYNVSPSSSTTYYVAASNGNCESDRRSVRVTVNPKPSIPSVSDKTICQGETTVLSASGSGTIKWYNSSSGGSVIHTGSTYSVSPSSTTTYYVASSNGNCESDRKSVRVTVNPKPSIPGVSDKTICQGETTVLSASGSGTIKWYNSSSGGSVIHTGSTYSVSPSSTTTYYVASSNGNCESDRKSVRVTVNPKPSIPSVSDKTICQGETVVLSASGSGTMKWYNSSSGGSVIHTGSTYSVSPSSTTTYYVASSNGNCESDRRSVRVTVNPKPSIPSVSDKTICQGETVVLSASGSGTMKWYNSSSGGSVIHTGSTYSVSPSSTTTYYVASSNGNCESDRKSVQVTVNPKPSIPSVSDKTICQGETVVLSASGSGTMKWYNSSSGGSVIHTGSTYSVSPSNTTTYYVASSNGNCESDRKSVRVTVNPKPSIPSVSDKTICQGETVALSATGSGTIKWYLSDTGGTAINTGSTYSVSPQTTTTYYVAASNGSCESERKPVTVQVNTRPNAPVVSNVSVCVGDSETLVASGNGTIRWYDSNTNGNIIHTGTSYEITPESSVTYYLTSFNGSCESDFSTLQVIVNQCKPDTGALKVLISPQNALSSAKWNVDSGDWYVSGETVQDLSIGQHVVTFFDLENWDTPENMNVNIQKSQTSTITGEYIPHTGSLTVILIPSSAIGSKWSIDNGNSWFSNGEKVPEILVGDYTIVCKDIDGWIKPGNKTVSIIKDNDSSATMTYEEMPEETGAISVRLYPDEATGAQWKVDQSSWQNSGETVPNLSEGDYTVSFKPVFGWVTPPDQTITVTANETNEITALYTQTLLAGWETKITATGQDLGDVYLSDVYIGVAEEAIKMDAVPFTPPKYSVNLQMFADDWTGPYKRLIYKNNRQVYYWYIAINPHGNIMPPDARTSTLSWDPSTFSSEGFYQLRSGAAPDGEIVVKDMRTTSRYDVTGTDTVMYFTITWGFSVNVEMELVAGWHMLSLPVTPDDNSLTALFPDASAAYKFEGTYVPVDTLEPGTGYWVKLTTGGTYSISGQDFTCYKKSLPAGWHLIGSVNATAMPLPADCIAVIYGFDRSYYPSESLEPGKAYWIKLIQACEISVCAD
jgi:cold shock CspA family protein